MLTNTQSGTNVHEIADGIFRINTPIAIPGGPDFNFNQYLVVDDEPLLFHSGPRGLFHLVREAIDHVMPVARLRYVGFSHFEADECGALNAFLGVAPEASPLCSRIAALVSVNDIANRPARTLGDGETLSLGRHVMRWFDTPHVPHGWDCGLMMDTTTRTFFCGDLYTQGGPGTTPLTSSDILGPSEAFRKQMDYYSHAPDTKERLLRLAKEKPTILACMHGSAWRGDGEQLLRALAEAVG
jgi:flavorubredoxin